MAVPPATAEPPVAPTGTSRLIPRRRSALPPVFLVPSTHPGPPETHFPKRTSFALLTTPKRHGGDTAGNNFPKRASFALVSCDINSRSIYKFDTKQTASNSTASRVPYLSSRRFRGGAPHCLPRSLCASPTFTRLLYPLSCESAGCCRSESRPPPAPPQYAETAGRRSLRPVSRGFRSSVGSLARQAFKSLAPFHGRVCGQAWHQVTVSRPVLQDDGRGGRGHQAAVGPFLTRARSR